MMQKDPQDVLSVVTLSTVTATAQFWPVTIHSADAKDGS